jgi:hypothetical protein
MNKKAIDKILSVYWFAILFIVAAAIVYMAVLFYGEPYEIRNIEANIMVNQIADCLSSGGYLNKKIIDDEGKFLLNNSNFLNICHLDFNVEDFKGWKNDQYYVEIDISEVGKLDNSFKITNGNINLRENCNEEGKFFPVCVERNFYTSNKNKNQYMIKILSIVRKTEKNVQ